MADRAAALILWDVTTSHSTAQHVEAKCKQHITAKKENYSSWPHIHQQLTTNTL